MSSHAATAAVDIKRPKAWKYILGAVLLFPFLFLLWLVFDFRVLHQRIESGEASRATQT